MKTIGFDRPLYYILPFDHRSSFETKATLCGHRVTQR
jgi:hypothetical protein